MREEKKWVLSDEEDRGKKEEEGNKENMNKERKTYNDQNEQRGIKVQNRGELILIKYSGKCNRKTDEKYKEKGEEMEKDLSFKARHRISLSDYTNE